MSRYIESVARTNRLHCSNCYKKIAVGEDVIFKLSSQEAKMLAVYCNKCKVDYEQRAIEDEEHPFSSDALGQN